MEKVVQKQVPTVPPVPVQPTGAGILKKISKPENKMKKLMPFIVGALVVIAGTTTGYVLAKGGSEISESPDSDMEAGVSDDTVFKDEAEGKLVEGGMEEDGTHHLERGAGPEKDVYLTSTVIDLQSFVGKEVKVWGESIASQKASWLMDVGRIKVIK